MADSTPLDAPGPSNLRADPLAAPPREARPTTVATLNARRAELQALFGTHAAKVKGYYRRSGVGDANAEDLAQEAFARALRGLPQFKGDSKMSTWLWTIAQKLLLEHRRKRTVDIAEVDGEPVDVDSLSISTDPHLIVRNNCVRRAFQAFSNDHPERAQAIYLHAVEGFTNEELAAFLGRTTHAATQYLSQCKARIKDYMRHCHDE